jgi:hypothetical protein
MNVAGKSLQDIYDAGAKRLEELESGQQSSLNDATETHLEERNRIEPESLKRLEERTEELEGEIKSYLDRGLERVEKAVATEGQASERYIGRLVESLVLLSKKFSESIGQLRESAESELSDLAGDSHNQYKRHGEMVNAQLREESTTALDSARTTGTHAEAAVSDTLEMHWNLVYQAETEAIQEVSGAFNENLDRLNAKALDTRRSLEEIVDHKLLTLEGRLSQSSDNIRSTVDTVTEQAERHAFDADVHLKEKFSSLLYEMSTSFDDSAARAASDIGGLHEASMADLTMKSQELSREMDSLKEDVTGAAGSKCETLKGKGTSLVDSFTDELNTRLESSNVFLKEIEGERAELVNEIWQELTEVKSKFEEKMAQLAQSTLDKMQAICDEAETAVSNAQQNCLTESRNHAQSKREGIEQETQGFLDRVNSTRQAALDAIAKAAGGSPPEMDGVDTGKKSDKKSKHNESEKQEKEEKDEVQEVAAEADPAPAPEEKEEEPAMANPRPVTGEETMIDGDSPGGRRGRRNRDRKSGDKK